MYNKNSKHNKLIDIFKPQTESNSKFSSSNKRAFIVWDNFLPWIIGIGVLFVSAVYFLILRGEGSNVLDFLKGVIGF